MSIHEVYPYLRVRNASEAIDWYIRVFGAKEIFRLIDPSDGRVGHSELDFDGHTIMFSDAFPEYGIYAPSADRDNGVGVHLHVENADEVCRRAVEAGATLLREPTDQFYGERGGTFTDPFGHQWMVGHEIEKVSHQEMQRRYDAMVQ